MANTELNGFLQKKASAKFAPVAKAFSGAPSAIYFDRDAASYATPEGPGVDYLRTKEATNVTLEASNTSPESAFTSEKVTLVMNKSVGAVDSFRTEVLRGLDNQNSGAVKLIVDAMKQHGRLAGAQLGADVMQMIIANTTYFYLETDAQAKAGIFEGMEAFSSMTEANAYLNIAGAGADRSLVMSPTTHGILSAQDKVLSMDYIGNNMDIQATGRVSGGRAGVSNFYSERSLGELTLTAATAGTPQSNKVGGVNVGERAIPVNAGTASNTTDGTSVAVSGLNVTGSITPLQIGSSKLGYNILSDLDVDGDNIAVPYPGVLEHIANDEDIEVYNGANADDRLRRVAYLFDREAFILAARNTDWSGTAKSAMLATPIETVVPGLGFPLASILIDQFKQTSVVTESVYGLVALQPGFSIGLIAKA